MKRRELLLQAIVAAQHLTEPGEANGEYIRGQAELVCDLFGLPHEHSRQDIMELIRGRVAGQAATVEASQHLALAGYKRHAGGEAAVTLTLTGATGDMHTLVIDAAQLRQIADYAERRQ